MAMTPEQMVKAQAALAANPNIGRRKLMAACGCTAFAAQKLLNGGTVDVTTSPGRLDVVKPKTNGEPLRGFAVGAETRMTSKKPVSTLRARFYQLKRGMAYKIEDVARDWVTSAETIRRHAQDADCFRYVETGNEIWEPCVMHPDTAKQYPVK